MTSSLKRGWCPGALRPMQSGDGLIVRVRPRLGSLSIAAMEDIAQGAAKFGNGVIDLTRRANLQIRGVEEHSLEDLHDLLRTHNLLDDTASAEQVRNIIVSPLSNLDPNQLVDIEPIARALEARLVSDQRLWNLPSKFGFILDSGARPSLENESADIRLVATRSQNGKIGFKLGLDQPSTPKWVGTIFEYDAEESDADETDAEKIVDIIAAISLLVIESTGANAAHTRRMRNLSPDHFAAIETLAKRNLQSDGDHPNATFTQPDDCQRVEKRPLGLIEHENAKPVLALAAPFGSSNAKSWLKLISAAKKANINEVRLSPWRTCYLPLPSAQCATPLLNAAADAGFITDPGDPILKIDACPGAPACASAMSDTRGDARKFAQHLARSSNAKTIHFSGCAKGCARSKPAELMFVSQRDGYGVGHNATASQDPETVIPFENTAQVLQKTNANIASVPVSPKTRNPVRA